MAFQGQQGQARKVSAAEAAALVKSGMWLDWGFGLVQPDRFDQALAARKDELTGREDPHLPQHAPAPGAGMRS